MQIVRLASKGPVALAPSRRNGLVLAIDSSRCEALLWLDPALRRRTTMNETPGVVMSSVRNLPLVLMAQHVSAARLVK